ncbi:hypothetical protein [Streptomyces sp. NRRL S-920]|uniref:hypothetical protein n=1 Tax=Streptomyces sp. NRRL S-920 TaxID=1463921 RepID=UPI0004C5A4C8|nr:hypothetical protein [Streptomyces sp. NRRL S-920]
MSVAEIAGAVIALPLFVVLSLVVFLIRVADVIAVVRVVAGGEGDGRVTLGLDVLLVLGVCVESDGERVHVVHRCAERQDGAVREQGPSAVRTESLDGFAEGDVELVHRSG